MIVVEGPDGAGKTSLIEKLSDHLEIDVGPKAVDHDMTAMVDIKRYVEDVLAKDFHPLIYDRFALISGCIYGSIYGMHGTNESFVDFSWLRDMQHRFLQQVDPIIIWCLPPFKTVWKNITEHETNKVLSHDMEKMRQVYWLYHCRASLEPVPLLYDYTKDSPNILFREVETELEERD